MLASRGRRAADSGGAALLRADQGNSRVPSLLACSCRRRRHCAVGSQRPGDRPESAALGWPARLRPSCRCAQRALRFHGRVHRRPGAALFHRLHGARQVGHALLRDMLVFIGGFIALVYSANLFIFYLCWELVGLCSFALVGFWYTNREAVNGARKVLLMTHIAGYGLLAGNSRALSPRRQRAVDRSRRDAQLHRRHLCADAGGAGGQERAGSAAHLDSRSHGRAYSGERAAARRLLRQRPASIWPRACTALARGRRRGARA